jgi:phosphomannomutase
VARAAAAIGQYLIDSGDTYTDGNGELSVVIGFDARVNSDVFAKDSAEIFAGLGLKVFLFDKCVPTPVTAFTGKRLTASASIMVTASHNPPRDNGYKVYLGGPNGHSQLVSPADHLIAEYIQKFSQTHSFEDFEKSSNYQLIGEHEIALYQARAMELAQKKDSDLKICYTALHGVGWAVVRPILEGLGFKNVVTVNEQIEPDGSFPTVTFPNPEEKGAMDLAYEVATKNQAEVIIANDPDADRLAVAIPDSGKWRMLTGDEIGLILGEEVAKAGTSGNLANSIVSSDLLGKVAEHYRLGYVQTLTGFKWISKTKDLRYGYEEALGYCVDPDNTPDKDGITAAVKILNLARELKEKNSSIAEHLETLSERYGFVKTGQISIRVQDLGIIRKIMSGLRELEPKSLGSWAVSFEDLQSGKELPSTDGVILSNSEVRVIIRPSGTEPKLKCYLLARGDSAFEASQALSTLESNAQDLLSALQ